MKADVNKRKECIKSGEERQEEKTRRREGRQRDVRVEVMIEERRSIGEKKDRKGREAQREKTGQNWG